MRQAPVHPMFTPHGLDPMLMPFSEWSLIRHIYTGEYEKSMQI